MITRHGAKLGEFYTLHLSVSILMEIILLKFILLHGMVLVGWRLVCVKVCTLKSVGLVIY